MEETKPWWTSKTLWTNAVMLGVTVGTFFGLELGLDPDAQIAVVGGIMAVVNIALRFVTTKAVGG